MHTSSSKVLPINAGNAIKLLPAKFLLLLLSYLKAKLYLIIYLFIYFVSSWDWVISAKTITDSAARPSESA